MSGKPRKAFDGIARPQGFIDDAAKAALKAVRGAVGRKAKTGMSRGGMYTKAIAAEKRLKTYTSKPMPDGREFDEYDFTGIANARAEDRADVAAFMAKRKRRK